ETLVTSQSLRCRSLFAAVSRPVTIVSSRQSGEIGNVFVERKFAVYVKTRQRLVSVELCCEHLRSVLEMFQVRRRPPILISPFRVKQRSGRVEAVADLVSYHRTDAAVIDHWIGIHVEERRIED